MKNVACHLLYCWLVTKSCPMLCHPMDSSPPGSSVHGILQARVLGWVAMPSSRGLFWLRDWTLISCIGRLVFFLPLSHQGETYFDTLYYKIRSLFKGLKKRVCRAHSHNILHFVFYFIVWAQSPSPISRRARGQVYRPYLLSARPPMN